MVVFLHLNEYGWGIQESRNGFYAVESLQFRVALYINVTTVALSNDQWKSYTTPATRQFAERRRSELLYKSLELSSTIEIFGMMSYFMTLNKQMFLNM